MKKRLVVVLIFMLCAVAFSCYYHTVHLPQGRFANARLKGWLNLFKEEPVIPSEEKKNRAVSQTLFTPEQERAIEQIIHQYLRKNPGILEELESLLRNENRRKEEAQIKRIEAKLPNFLERLTNHKRFEIAAFNIVHDLVLVEFTQPLCPSCKRSHSALQQFLKKYGDKIQHNVFLWPFFGGESVYLSRLILAARLQGKMEEVYRVILQNMSAGYDRTLLLEEVKKIKDLNFTQLLADLKKQRITDAIKANFSLAKKLELLGTPTLILVNIKNQKFVLLPGNLDNLGVELNDALKRVQ